ADFEGRERPPIAAFGLAGRAPGEFAAGTEIENRDDGTTVVNEDGSFVFSTSENPEDEGFPRIYFVAETPPDFTMSNYDTVMGGAGMAQAFINTLTVTIPATVIPILIAAFAAYALAWMDFPGRGLLIAAVVGLLVVPLQLALVPLLKLHQQVGIGQSFLGIWLAHTGFGLPLAIYLLRNYMVGLPRDIIESARVDGATDFQIFTRIILPLSFPALASFAIFQFLWTWNDLLVAKVFLPSNDESWVMTVRIADDLLGSRGGDWGILAAAAFVSIAVPLVVFFTMQRYLVRGLLAGSVK
ncbi:carbohydrate ABC transporter permease, partial [Roseicyclus sp.]|uniref:carbohydrate ABC transporter permease n=1 Tax=Roseicyclus sp. TaxID=1914329 RepID=UPI003F9EDB9E